MLFHLVLCQEPYISTYRSYRYCNSIALIIALSLLSFFVLCDNSLLNLRHLTFNILSPGVDLLILTFTPEWSL